MKLSWIHLRYFPPGLILQYTEENGRTREKIVDLLDFEIFSNSMEVAETIIQQVGESLLAKKHKRLLLECLEKLKGKMLLNHDKKFHTFRMLRTHAMPLTDACLTKDGTKCLTTSYDRTCRIWDIQEGKELLTLGDHIDIVCCVSINPTCDRVLTGSYDGTVRLWRVSLDQEDVDSDCLHILRGADMAEVQVAQFSPDYLLAAAGSSDSTTTIYDLTSGVAMYTLEGHDAEISAVAFDQSCQTVLTGSYDSMLGLWDLRSGSRITYYKGHEAEVVSCLFNFSCDKIASGSMDATVRLWDIRKDRSCLSVFIGHAEEVTDVQFDYRGKTLASASKDGQLLICDVPTCTTRFNINAHNAAINRIRFSPNGGYLLTCSDDKTSKLWRPEFGDCSQILEGHSGRVITACFSYLNESILTAGTDNTCRLWR